MHRSRKQHEEGDYFLIYGCDVAVVHDGANITATWNRVFYWLESATVIEPAYVYDNGNGAKSVPVFYFGPGKNVPKDDIPIGTLVDDAIETTGSQEGYLTFSISNAREEVSLYVYEGVGKKE
jgi:hypothetical protein